MVLAKMGRVGWGRGGGGGGGGAVIVKLSGNLYFTLTSLVVCFKCVNLTPY